MEKIKDREKRLNRRLLMLVPAAVAILFLLSFTADKTRVASRIFSVGYEGPMRLLPDITIIDNKGLESELFSEEKHRMTVRDVEIFSENEENVEEENPVTSTAPEKKLEEEMIDEISGVDYLRTYASHTDVPYRQDFVILSMVEPEYPEDAFRRRVEGYALVEVYVDESGRVAEARVIRAQGLQSFESASLEAVRKFLFRPVVENGVPQPFWISFLISFRLKT